MNKIVGEDGSIYSTSSVPTTISAVAAGKIHHRTPSPSRILVNNGVSPVRKVAISPTGSGSSLIKNVITAASNLGPPPIMKPISMEDTKDPLLQPLNANMSKNNNNGHQMGSSTNTTTATKETSRVNGDFKKNNPNLKLQMPLPTTHLRNKLLDSNPGSATSAPITIPNISTNLTTQLNENINQFGFNTSSVSNVPVSMTPISEKNIDFGARLKRSQSTSNRKASNSFGDHSTTSNGIASTVNNVAAAESVAPNGTPLQTIASSASIATYNSMVSGGSTSNKMHPPPNLLDMSIFQDMDFNNLGSGKHIDKKPQMLSELENLLRMFEEGLPAIEAALEKQLITTPGGAEDHCCLLYTSRCV